ncbi:LysR family transcriptional regulator [Amnibacterium kyonggiense]
MDLPTVEAFVAVAEEQHFGAAAARLHLVQSSVSAAIARLERELGARLLDRSPRSVSLTGAGLAVLPEARRLLAAGERMRVAARGEAGLTGTVRFGTFSALPVLDLPASSRRSARRTRRSRCASAPPPPGRRGSRPTCAPVGSTPP